MAIELPEVSEAFEANIAPFVAAMHVMQDELLATAADVKALQGLIDSLHGHTIDIGIETTGAGAAAAAAAVNDLAGAEYRLSDASQLQVEASQAQAEAAGRVADALSRELLTVDQIAPSYTRALIANAEFNRATVETGHDLNVAWAAADQMNVGLAGLKLVAAGAAAGVGASGAAAVTAGRGWTIFGLNFLTVAHWVVAGSAEFLAVAVPAAVALGAGLAVAAQGAQNVQQHFQALYAATESTYSAFHQTVGSVLGLGSALQNAQNAANPGVYEILGSAVNDAKSKFADFASMGLQVVHMFDEFSARITVDLKKGLGTELNGLLNGAVTDLQRFGNVLGNLGHALLNFAAAMPGLAHALLDIAVGLSAVIEWASRLGPVLTFGMALEEMYRWGGLVLTMLVRLTGAMGAMNAMGATNFVTRFGAAILALTGRFAQGLTALGSWVSGLGNAEGVLGRIGGALQTAGAEAAGFAESLSPGMVAAVAAGAAVVGFLAYKLVTMKTATEQWAAASSAVVAKASDLNVLPTIYTQLADTLTRASAAQRQFSSDSQHFSQNVVFAGRAGQIMSDSMRNSGQNTAVLSQHMLSLIATANTVRGNINLLAGVFHTSAIGALALANAAGVNLQVGLTKGSVAAKIAEQQITNLKTGLGAMAAPAGVIGADMQAVGIQSQLASSKVATVNQALDAFIGTTTGGMNTLMQFNAAIHAMGKDTVSSSQSINGAINTISHTAASMGYSLQGIGPKAQQSWQQFDAAVQQGNSVLDTFRTGMAEGVVTQQQYTREIQAVGGALLPFAAHNKTALAIVSQLAQEMGDPATHSLKTLASEFGVTGKAAQNMATTGMEQAVAKMANLSVVARNLSVTVGSQLDTVMASAITKFSGVQGAAQKYAAALANVHTPAATVAKDQAAYNTAMQRETSMTATATTDINKHASSLVGLATGYKDATTSAGDYAKSSQNVSTALQDTIARARDAATTTQGFGQQARTAATSASGLASNATQATSQVKNLGSAAQTTQGHLGDVNNEIRTAASAAGAAGGPLSAMAANIGRVGAEAMTAAGQVRTLEGAIASLQSKSITLTTNMVTVTSTVHRQHGGPVWPGIPAVVGEAGPELFIPSQAGYIMPNSETERFLSSPGAPSAGTGGGGGGFGTINLTHTTHVTAMVDQTALFDTVKTETARYAVRNGNPQQGRLAPGKI